MAKKKAEEIAIGDPVVVAVEETVVAREGEGSEVVTNCTGCGKELSAEAIEAEHELCDECFASGKFCHSCLLPLSDEEVAKKFTRHQACFREWKGWGKGKDSDKGKNRRGGDKRERKSPRKCRECHEVLPEGSASELYYCDNCHQLWVAFESSGNAADEIEARIGKAADILGGDAVIEAVEAYASARSLYTDGKGVETMRALHGASVLLDLAFVKDRGESDEERYGFANDYGRARRVLGRVKVLLNRGDIHGAERVCKLVDAEITAVTACGAVTYAEKTLSQADEFKVDLGDAKDKKSLRARIARTAETVKSKLAKRQYRDARKLGSDLQRLVGEARKLKAFEVVLEAEQKAKGAEKRQANLKERTERKPTTATFAEIAGIDWETGEEDGDGRGKGKGRKGGGKKVFVEKKTRKPASTKGRGGRRQRLTDDHYEDED